MKLLPVIFGVVLIHSAAAQTLQDVIYKKDGSVLRGTLVEQDFDNGRYKIRLDGGSIFSVSQEEITKITKEAPLAQGQANSGVNININNNPSITQNPQLTSSQALPVYPEEKSINGTFYIGTMNHTLKASNIFMETEFVYSGLNIGGQANFNRHFALYADLNIGSYSERTDTDSFGNSVTYSGDDLTDETYTSAQIAAILSTNLYQGWQFFTGLGAFSESYSTDDNSFQASGSDFQLGLGYSWKTLQLLLRINILNSSDYDDNVDSSTTGHLQLGFNF
ncbi:MAG: hypothetical protein HWE18_03235 [Gammaproteobacteria bacterium]|nr:hypothetical protein [Gammaproteobacteria bacterium]